MSKQFFPRRAMRRGFIRWRAKAPVNESVEEAKNPGAMLGLIMGAYPLMLFAFIMLLIAYSYFVHPMFSGPVDRDPTQSSGVADTR